jgi:hypothetical protein
MRSASHGELGIMALVEAGARKNTLKNFAYS